MLARRIISFLLFIWIVTGIYFLVSYYLYLYDESHNLVLESIKYKENLIKWEKKKEVTIKLEENKTFQSEVDSIILKPLNLDDLLAATEKKKQELVTLSAEEQQIKHDLASNFTVENVLSTTDKIKLLKEKRDKWEEQKAVIGQKLRLEIPQIDLSLDTLPITIWNVNLQQIKDEDIYSSVDTLLESGPVRFPWIDIVDKWVTTIYSHSSQTRSIKNYSFFKTLPFVWVDQDIFITSKYKRYKYTVVESLEMETKDVDVLKKKYESVFPEKKYIFLVTCYPINTSKKRWVVIAEQLK